MKRWICLFLALALCLSAFAVTALAACPFTDVPEKEWYYADVVNAYGMGLINGKTATTFKPNDNLTYAEAVKLAACMHQRYTTGAVTLKNGSPKWYQSYVDYCIEKDIITKIYEWDQPATRAGYMEIFAKALPDSALGQINHIPDGIIPDVPMTHNQAEAIYKLYRAGIAQGTGKTHACNPGASIKRSEVAAILSRMMDSNKRIWFTMVDGLWIEQQPADVTCNVGDVAEFAVQVTGGRRPYSYKWEFITEQTTVWQNAGAADDAVMKIKVTEDLLKEGQRYRCVITDADGNTITSAEARLLQEEDALRFVTQPQSVVAEEFDYASFLVEVEGGRMPYTFEWLTVGYRGLIAPVDHMPEVTITGDSTSSRIEIKVGAKDDWTVTQPFFCVVTDADGKEITSDHGEIELNLPLTIDYQSGDQLLHTYQPSFTLTFSGGVGPYVTIWEAEVDGSWVNMKNLRSDVNYYESGWERTCQFQTYVGNDLTIRCVIFDALGNSVTSKEFHAFLN